MSENLFNPDPSNELGTENREPGLGRETCEEEFERTIIEALSGHFSITDVHLTGSRASQQNTEFSDWDFAVSTSNFEYTATNIQTVVKKLLPLGTFWDPLGSTKCFVAILSGPKKVDFIFEEPQEEKQPYVISRQNLAQIDLHFWDWTIWLVSKEKHADKELVASELHKMYDFILSPMGVSDEPEDIASAVRSFLDALKNAEEEFKIRIDSKLKEECLTYLRKIGYKVG